MPDLIKLVRVGRVSPQLRYSRNYRAAKKIRLDEIKAERGCSRCGENDPECLDFHHIDQASKTYTVARLYAGTWKWERVLQEIALCELLCANCHRKEHGRDKRH